MTEKNYTPVQTAHTPPAAGLPEWEAIAASSIACATGDAAVLHRGGSTIPGLRLSYVYNFTRQERYTQSETVATGAVTYSRPQSFDLIPTQEISLATERYAALKAQGAELLALLSSEATVTDDLAAAAIATGIDLAGVNHDNRTLLHLAAGRDLERSCQAIIARAGDEHPMLWQEDIHGGVPYDYADPRSPAGRFLHEKTYINKDIWERISDDVIVETRMNYAADVRIRAEFNFKSGTRKVETSTFSGDYPSTSAAQALDTVPADLVNRARKALGQANGG